MLAAVLSGGGNLGALQAGALEVLLAKGVRPELWVGTSAGSLNAIMMASNPTMEGVRHLQELWREARPVPEAAGALFTVTRRFATGKESLFPNEPIVEYVQKNLPPGIKTFGELTARSGQRAFTIAVSYPEGKVRVFGVNRGDKILDGAMASSALPPYFPPWEADGIRYIDGGIAANLPLRTAIEYGADEILALNIHGDLIMIKGSGILDISGFALGRLLGQQIINELEWAAQEGVVIHLLHLDPGPVKAWDFSQADVLFERGRKAALAFLDTGGTIPRVPAWRGWIRRGIKRRAGLKNW